MSLKWENYVLKSGSDCLSFWKSFVDEKTRDILYILAIGFDPRTYNGINTIFDLDNKGGKRDVVGIRYYTTEKKDDPSDDRVKKHLENLESFLSAKAFPAPYYKDLILRSDSDTSTASINAASEIITDINDIMNYTDIIVDISAMPRTIFIALANKILNLVEDFNSKNNSKINLHLVATENPLLDAKIIEQGVEESPTYVQGFTVVEKSRTNEYKKVWIPILGENQIDQFTKILNLVQPDEICPILPFPSVDLRRGDELIHYYQDKLFNDPAFSLNNIIYTDESNPFQTYRLLVNTIWRYKKSFDILKGCKIYLSTLSSKLLSIGTLLAAYETKQDGIEVGILHVESRGHKLIDGLLETEIKNISNHNYLVEIWLAGESYEK
ncbi:MAG: hypothetical protein JST58_16350 [Bacteroidetes bacterium]|nr:hypothetical protein [Bacteroidota bacterium]